MEISDAAKSGDGTTQNARPLIVAAEVGCNALEPVVVLDPGGH